MRGFLCVLGICAAGVLPASGVSDDDPRVSPVVRAYRKAGPAVVNISTEKLQQVGLFGSDPFEDIFPYPSPFVGEVPVQSLGSGVVIHPSGYIVTNAHVVRKAQKIAVTLSDKKRYEARVISTDPIMQTVKARDEESLTLPAIRDALLPKLMSGEIRVREAQRIVGRRT